MFGGPKIPKTQQPDKTPFTIFKINENKDERPDRVRVVSIDPGISNFCLRVEDRPYYSSSYDQSITSNLYFRKPLKKADTCIDDDNVCHYQYILTKLLDSHWGILKEADIVIVERQMPFNYKAVRLSQHVISYFSLRLETSNAILIEIDPKLKTSQLKAPNTLNKRGIKLWAIEKAEEILKKRNDEFSLAILKKERKKDDLADTVCQIEALFDYLEKPVTDDLYRFVIN